MDLEIQKLTNIIWACIKYFENYKSNSTGTTKSLSLPIKPGQGGGGLRDSELLLRCSLVRKLTFPTPSPL